MLSCSASSHFALGLFSANCSSGLAVTKAPERWSGSWEDNLVAAQIADEGGLDFPLPIARWIGCGGETNFHEGVLEPIAWAAALLARTSNIDRAAELPYFVDEVLPRLRQRGLRA